MPVVAIVSQKGGAGKTTLALNLAACAAYNGSQSAVIDIDPQATAAAWGDWRGEFLPAVITCPPVRLARTIQNAAKNGAEFIVIDTPPHGDMAAREALRAADLVLIPTRPRAFDLHALEATAEQVAHIRKPVFVVLNAVPAGATRIVAEATSMVGKLGLPVCPIHLGDRGAFHRSAMTGEVASEVEPDGKAAAEVTAIWQWVTGQLADNRN